MKNSEVVWERRTVNIGLGLPFGPLPFNGAGGVSNTFILKDFAR